MNITDFISLIQAMLNTAQSNAKGYQAQADSLTAMLDFAQKMSDAGIPDIDTAQTLLATYTPPIPLPPTNEIPV